MGKRIKVQRRGRGSPTFRASKKRKRGPVKHPIFKDQQEEPLKGEIINLEHERGRSAPLARIFYENGSKEYMIAPEGVAIGQEIVVGDPSDIRIGNTLPLKDIPEGTSVYNIESQPGDGGKFARAGGTYATVVTRDKQRVIVKLPSGKTRSYNPRCRATIGVVAGGGRTEKPFVKAGNKFHHCRAKNQKYPVNRGVAMVAASHPHGGGQKQHIGKKSSCVSRNAPPGRKVGLIAARRSGRKKR
ncbi:MAG: 50S ribosomal protein L2 [Candidatus Helarchaeota archaeon]